MLSMLEMVLCLFLFLLLIANQTYVVAFTCQGANRAQALAACPDGGSQKLSAGGNVTIYLYNATNVPVAKTATGTKSNPYIVLQTTNGAVTSSYLRNTAQPSWHGEVMSLGILTSATTITVSIWDKEGALIPDSLLASTTFQVPYCSMFYPNNTAKYYDLDLSCQSNPYTCQSTDSLWAMPNRQLCMESGPIVFGGGTADNCGAGGAICVYLEVKIVPFVVDVEMFTEDRSVISYDPVVSVLGEPNTNAPWTTYFGFPFIGDLNNAVDLSQFSTRNVLGAVMITMAASDKGKGHQNQIAFQASTNMPAIIYVCRPNTDNNNGIPDWLATQYNAKNRSVIKLIIAGNDATYFNCYYQYVPGTTKNQWGGIIANPIPFYSNTIAGHDQGTTADQAFYAFNYIILALPYQPTTSTSNLSVSYANAIFVAMFFEYGLIWAWFFFLSARYLRKQINYRLNRIPLHLMSREYKTGDKRSVLYGLFSTYNLTPGNNVFRGHLHHAKNMTLFCLFLPVALIAAWGGAVAAAVQPPALGFLLSFSGMAGVLFWYGHAVWKSAQYRMVPESFVSIMAATLSLLCAGFTAVFQDIGVLNNNFQLNFPGLSVVFGAFNALPLLAWIFREDQNFKINFKVAMAKFEDYAQKMQIQAEKQARTDGRHSSGSQRHESVSKAGMGSPAAVMSCSANAALHALLGSCYTINPKVPMFRLAVALPEHPVDTHPHPGAGGKDVIPPPTGGAYVPPNTPASASANTSVTQLPGDDGMRARLSISQQQRRVGSAVMHRRSMAEGSGGGNLISAAAGLGQGSSYAHDLASQTPSIGTQYVIDTILDRGGDGDTRPSRITPEPSLYNASLLVLIIYIIVAAVRTAFPSLAFLNCCALVLLDTVHSGLSRGSNEWSPGFKILLLITGRLIIMSSGPALWVVNYSVAYMVYALPLLQALINKYLPHLSKRQAGEMIFANEDHLNKTFPDVAGSEYFCFGLLTLAFISILLVTGLDQQTARLNMLPKDPVPFAGTNWPALTFGVFAILLVVVGGLLMAAIRAFHLEFHGLLKGWSRDSFLIKRIINIPRILALAAEVGLLFTGLLIYAITTSNALLTLFIYLPPIGACLGHAFRVWKRQDYVLVIWPPQDVIDAKKQAVEKVEAAAAAGDLGATFGQLAVAFGDYDGGDEPDMDNDFDGGDNHPESEEDLALVDFPGPFDEGYTSYDDILPKKAKKHVASAEHVLRGFRIPKLEATGFKLGAPVVMPALPQKSVLRRKRMEMKVPVKGQGAGDGSPTKEKREIKVAFESKKETKSADEERAEAMRAMDKQAGNMWSKFDEYDQEEVAQRHASELLERREREGAMGPRRGFRNHPLALSLGRMYRRSPLAQRIHRLLACVTRPFYLCLSRSLGCLWWCCCKSNVNEPIYDLASDDGSQDGDHNKAMPVDVSVLSQDNMHPHDPSNDQYHYHKPPNLLHYPFWSAVTEGYLNTSEYTALGSWFGAMGLFAAMGITLGETCVPEWVGYCVWVGCWMLVCTMVPLIEYFATYRVTMQMQRFGYFIGLLHFVFCVTFFLARLDADTFLVASLWVLDYFIYYPLFLYLLVSLYAWYDAGFPLTEKRKDKPTTVLEWILRKLERVNFYAFLMMMLLLCFQFFVWVNPDGYYLGGVISLLIILTYLTLSIFVQEWARQGFYLPPVVIAMVELISKAVSAVCVVVAVVAPVNPMFALSIAYCAAMLWQIAAVALRLSSLRPDALFYFSPFVLPVYALDPATNDVTDETKLVKSVFKGLLLTCLWGAALAVFVYPVYIGATVFSIAFLLTGGVAVALASYVPVRLGKSTVMLTREVVAEAANMARTRFVDRRTPMTFELYDEEKELELNNNNSNNNNSANPSDPAQAGALAVVNQEGQGGGSGTSSVVSGTNGVSVDSTNDDSQTKEEVDENSEAYKLKLAKAEEERIKEETALAAARAAAEANQPLSAMGTGAMCVTIASDVIDEVKRLSYVREETALVFQAELEDKAEDPLLAAASTNQKVRGVVAWYQRPFVELYDMARRLFQIMPLAKLKDFRRHNEAPYTLRDVLAEMMMQGRGPFGCLGMSGLLVTILGCFSRCPPLAFLQPQWIEDFDNNGNDKSLFHLRYHLDVKSIYEKLQTMDQDLDFSFQDETRCAVHFLLLTVAATDAKLHHEQILFQKFLQHSRQRLAASGVPVPAGVFSSSSFASINIALVAIWLSTMTEKEKEKFERVKGMFDKEQAERDRTVDEEEKKCLEEERLLLADRRSRELQMCTQLENDMKQRLNERVFAFGETLYPDEKIIFNQRKEIWLTSPNTEIKSHEMEVYEKFAKAVFDKDETAAYARSLLAEIEGGQKDCRFGEYGRSFQYVDSTFFPNDDSVGQCFAAASVLGWRCAPGINSAAELVHGHPDPEEVEEGIFKDGWIAAALAMISAVSKRNVELADKARAKSNGSGTSHLYSVDNQLTPLQLALTNQLMQLFIGHNDDDGEYTYRTAVGAYAVRLYKRGLYFPVILDDLFPMLRRDEWTTENRGMACARAKECSALWVSLIEKAYAKFYGSYAELERGCVHHALQDLTGCESERVSLVPYSRGNGKKTLWARLLHHYKNGYILGASTGDANSTDKDVLERGILFSATYTLYDVQEVEGVQLIRLRNPPGSHPEWNGDWSDGSPLWTTKLKLKFQYTNDTTDNSFYMSFDDFCNIFKSLYVCKWYNQNNWNEKRHKGLWKAAYAYDHEEEEKTEEEKLTSMQRMMIEEGMASGPQLTSSSKEGGSKEKKKLTEEEKEALKERRMAGKARAAVDSAGGLPAASNPKCIVANNPQYSLKITRSSDIRISVTQTDSRGRLGNNVQLQPFAIYVLRNMDNKTPQRAGYLHKENVIVRSGDAKAERTQHLYASLTPGLYTIMVPCFQSGMEGYFRIDLIANYPNDFVPLWPPAWVLSYDDNKRKEDLDKFHKQKEAARVLAGGELPVKQYYNGAHIPDVHVDALDGRLLGQQPAIAPIKPTTASASPSVNPVGEGSNADQPPGPPNSLVTGEVASEGSKKTLPHTKAVIKVNVPPKEKGGMFGGMFGNANKEQSKVTPGVVPATAGGGGETENNQSPANYDMNV